MTHTLGCERVHYASAELRTPAGMRYSANPGHYVPRCKRCHVAFDQAQRVGESNVG